MIGVNQIFIFSLFCAWPILTFAGIFLAKMSYKPYICVIGIDYMVFGDGESIFEVKITLGTT